MRVGSKHPVTNKLLRHSLTPSAYSRRSSLARNNPKKARFSVETRRSRGTSRVHAVHACSMSRGRSRVITRELRFKIEVEGLWNRASVRPSTRGLLMSASQSGNFSTSRRVMHEPRGASRLYCPINQNEPGLATDAPPWRGSKRNRPPFHHGRTMKILDRDPAHVLRGSRTRNERWHGTREFRISFSIRPRYRLIPARPRLVESLKTRCTCTVEYIIGTFIVLSLRVVEEPRVTRSALYFSIASRIYGDVW